ncbi:MAG: RdgB/HAM1 family non-canonical purine NTP pyrophosphatase [Actinobacteria bacterium]|uniref:dITP/XTP pyrophosphatase n=1 Tax=freshwater metagenome TaxID=449393 RepID=A0A6J6AEE3_9ZZZZ|nr:RdgB/HAM1 family non-canonical purine NTP pyrophosphatase [Actinomycetota bacterium]
MPFKLLLATRNKGKITEFRRILDAVAPGEIELVGLDEFPELHDVVEDGATFQENALKKAREMSRATGIPAIADDSGLCVDALGGDPGIYSARWAGSHGDDAANTAKVLDQLRDIPDAQRGAHFTCVAALYLPDGRSHCEEAHFDGWILHAPVGNQGFGYDPIFRPDGYDLSSAQMSAEEKDAISHRGKSLRAIAPHVITLLNSLG